jgi:hypothetical protein
MSKGYRPGGLLAPDVCGPCCGALLRGDLRIDLCIRLFCAAHRNAAASIAAKSAVAR